MSTAWVIIFATFAGVTEILTELTTTGLISKDGTRAYTLTPGSSNSVLKQYNISTA